MTIKVSKDDKGKYVVWYEYTVVASNAEEDIISCPNMKTDEARKLNACTFNKGRLINHINKSMDRAISMVKFFLNEFKDAVTNVDYEQMRKEIKIADDEWSRIRKMTKAITEVMEM